MQQIFENTEGKALIEHQTIMAGVCTEIAKQPLGSNMIELNFVPANRPNQDGSHGNVFNAYHLDEHSNIMNDSLEKTVLRAPVAALICVYNEEWYSLQRSLESLAAIPGRNGDFDKTIVGHAVAMDIAIVIDGVEMLKPCMRDYLHQLFGPDIPVDVDKQGKAVGWLKSEFKPSETCVINKRTHCGHLLSLILKKNNQKKINSHEWGFRAFAQTSKCKYILTSDCGTRFDPKCVGHLFDYMEANEGCVACTGRQRVMSAEQQADPNQGSVQHPRPSLISICIPGWQFNWLKKQLGGLLGAYLGAYLGAFPV